MIYILHNRSHDKEQQEEEGRPFTPCAFFQFEWTEAQWIDAVIYDDGQKRRNEAITLPQDPCSQLPTVTYLISVLNRNKREP